MTPQSPAEADVATRVDARPILRRRQLAAIALGHGFEFYDFSVFGFFAVPIGRTFFPSSTPLNSLLLSLATLGLGFGARPLGALVFGTYADRHGRKPAMLLTVLLMALGTLGIAGTPGYAAIGVMSPILMVVARLIQGFALGGEIGPSTTYLLEHAPFWQRGRDVAWQYTLNGAAVLAAGLIGGGLSLALPTPALYAWGWRLALIVGLGVVPAGLAIRASLPAQASVAIASLRPPVWSALAQPGRFIAAILIIGSGTVVFSIGSFMTSFALTSLGARPSIAFLSPVALGAATMATAPLGGWLSDRIGQRRTLLASRIGMGIVALPAFYGLAKAHDGGALLVVSAVLAALSTLGAPAGLCMIVDAMPSESRATGLALVYTLGISIFGGTTQFAASVLTAWTGDLLAPAYILIVASLVGAAAAFGLPDTFTGREPATGRTPAN